KAELAKKGKIRLTDEEERVLGRLTDLERKRYLRLGRLKDRSLNLGLDLQGGMHLVLEVDTDKVLENEVNREVKALEKRLKKMEGVSFTIKKVSKDTVSLELTKAEDYEEAEKIIKGYGVWNVESKSDIRMALTYGRLRARRIKLNAREQALETIRRRVDEFGVAEPSIQPEGDRRIIIQLPGMKDPERAKRIIGRTAFLEFKLVADIAIAKEIISKIDKVLKDEEDNPFSSKLRYAPGTTREEGVAYELIEVLEKDVNWMQSILKEEYIANLVPKRYCFAFSEVREEEGVRYRNLYLLKREAELTGHLLANASPGFGQLNEPIVHLEFKRRGGLIMSKISRRAERQYNEERKVTFLAIVLDGAVYSAPLMKVRVSHSPIIEGNFTQEEANDLSLVLREGALPAPVTIEEERTVGASLGEDSIRAGVRAAIIGLIVVSVFISIYYLKAGLIANFALALNLIIILTVLSGLRATLTLPGIAGIILTIGMAVDANVLIFERIREEIRAGKTIRSGIAAGYGKAFLTILDANVTTLIAALVLFRFGTGPIRGFATTLSIGILVSMFTAIVVTRVIFDLLCRRRRFGQIKMMQLVGVPRISFIPRRKMAFALSGLVILVGMVSFFEKGEAKKGIDFTGGTLLVRGFEEPVAASRIREALSELGLEGSEIQQFDEGRGVIIRTKMGKGYTTTPQMVDDKLSKTAQIVDDKLREKFGGLLKDPGKFGKTDMVGAKVGRELKKKAIYALAVALVLIVIYIAWRFEFKFAIAAIVALMHDVLITAGFIALTNRQFNLPIIAALLTIVGYSLNDTIVIFDRIREDLKLMRREKYETIINISLNQTLSRTILTSLTTFLCVLSLFILGGEVIHDFAFALMVGIVAGTYSSIFIASPILVEWKARTGK
ncbi:protein translocase subunit SecD, partial [bacterium]|nr:protein translocase subunit SecD [bacterium]